jgi:hypothetical protein
VTRLRRTTRLRVHVSSAQGAENKHSQRGKPPARGTGAVAAGGRESEGGIGAVTSGNEVARGPGRAQAARVDGTFRRECSETSYDTYRWKSCRRNSPFGAVVISGSYGGDLITESPDVQA